MENGFSKADSSNLPMLNSFMVAGLFANNSDFCSAEFRNVKIWIYMSMIYVCGIILIAVTAVGPLGLPQRQFSIVGLFLIAVGSGGLSPCIGAFGGDQFVLPQQDKELAMYFSILYIAINVGALISTFLSPILRNDVQCFGADSCFPLAFGVPAVLTVVAIVILAIGRPFYTDNKPKGNVVVDVTKCIFHAITQKFKSNSQVEHWLDRSEDRYGPKLVEDVKSTFKILVIYLPIPTFWALFDQQGSAWTIQAVSMDGDVAGVYTILPDQMQIVNPLIVIGLIPFFNYVVYPLLSKCHLLRSPLQKMCAGGFLAALAFVISALVAIKLEKTYPQLPESGEMQLRVYDTSSCNYKFTSSDISISNQDISSYYVNKSIKLNGPSTLEFTFSSDVPACEQRSVLFEVKDKAAYGIYLNSTGAFNFIDTVSKSEDGYPRIRTLLFENKEIKYSHTKKSYSATIKSGDINLDGMPYPGTYTVDQVKGAEIHIKLGGTYTVLVKADGTTETFTVTNPNSVHMLWLLPQYVAITAAEIMFSITGYEFTYSQAPLTMKAFLQAIFMLTSAFGNLIIVVIEALFHFDKQSTDCFVYAALMVVDMFVFMFLAIRYKYVKQETSEEPGDPQTAVEPSQPKKK